MFKRQISRSCLYELLRKVERKVAFGQKTPISHIVAPEVDLQCSLLGSFHLHIQDRPQKQYLVQWW